MCQEKKRCWNIIISGGTSPADFSTTADASRRPPAFNAHGGCGWKMRPPCVCRLCDGHVRIEGTQPGVEGGVVPAPSHAAARSAECRPLPCPECRLMFRGMSAGAAQYGEILHRIAMCLNGLSPNRPDRSRSTGTTRPANPDARKRQRCAWPHCSLPWRRPGCLVDEGRWPSPWERLLLIDSQLAVGGDPPHDHCPPSKRVLKGLSHLAKVVKYTRIVCQKVKDALLDRFARHQAPPSSPCRYMTLWRRSMLCSPAHPSDPAPFSGRRARCGN